MNTRPPQAGTSEWVTRLNPTPAERAVLHRAPFADDPHLTTTVPEWLGRHANPHTLSTYRTDLRHYLLWCARVGLHPLAVHDPHQPGDVGPATFHAYEMHLRAQQDVPRSGTWSNGSLQRKISVVSSWYTWCHHTDAIPRNPRDGYIFGTPTPTIPTITPAQLDAFERAASNPPPGSATATRGPVLAALLRLGARPQQIIDLTGRHLSLSSESPHAKLPHRPRSDGTTPAPDPVPLDPAAIAALLAHFAHTGLPGPDQPLLPATTGGPLSYDSLLDYTDTLCRRARIPRTGPDELRRAFRYHATHPETP